MRILVVGVGKVGMTIATHLAEEDHDVVVIDTNNEVIERCGDVLDVLCIRGNGANAQTLMEAGAQHADIIIATTASDELNMLCCLVAKRLGTQFAIARIRDPEYNESLTILQRELGIDQVINPERATALEISRLLLFPFASNIESVAEGRVDIVEFRAAAGDPFVGLPLKLLKRQAPSLPQVLYVAIERNGKVSIPNGDSVIEVGDHVHVAGEMVTISAYFRYLGKNTKRVKEVMLLGGGKISYYLAQIITKIGIGVTMIEINGAKVRRLSELLPDANIIFGDGTDQDLLEQEGLKQMDAFVTLCDRDEENMMTGLYAAQEGVPRVIVKNNRVMYADILRNMGLDTIVSPREITCSMILRYVRARANGEGSKMEKLYRLIDGKAEAMEFIVSEGEPYIGIPLKDLSIRKNTLVAMIVRHGRVIVPFGNDHFEANDSVVIVAGESGIDDLNEVIHR